MHPFSATVEDLAKAKFAHVLGKPISHSLSPILHNAAYAYLDLPFKYSAIEANESECLSTIKKLRDGEVFGLSFTMPLKEVAAAAAEVRSPLVEKSQSANTLVLRDKQLTAENTDIYGITQALTDAGANFHEPWVVLGTGATARSAICALQELQVADVALIGRNQRNRDAICERFQIRTAGLSSDFPNLISTIPITAQNELTELVKGTHFLFDVTYGSGPSHFAKLVVGSGGHVVTGIEMLVHQAVLQIEIMTGKMIKAEVLFSALPNSGE